MPYNKQTVKRYKHVIKKSDNQCHLTAQLAFRHNQLKSAQSYYNGIVNV
jgi:hypothetical protein